MAKLLYVLSHSTDQPERATAALHAAAGAREGGHEVALWLQDEGVRLGVKGVAATLGGIGAGTAAGTLASLLGAGCGLHLSRRCFERREFEPDVVVEGGRLVEPADLGSLVDAGWTPVAT
jgi:predicted peroxiredoxin